jgi:glycosyltransferase involved in cell wall biosynthesis
MKIALVCDDLIQFGGAEKVVLAICEIWKDAPLYTAIASKEWMEICRRRGIDLRTSFMQKIPFSSKFNRYLAPFLLHTAAFQSFDLSGYDLVFSMSSRFAHQVITKSGKKHICYMHSPGRMFWEPYGYFENESYGVFGVIKKTARAFLALPLSVLRVIDYVAAKKVDGFISNSETTKARIKKYYGPDSNIIYPFVDRGEQDAADDGKGDYFLVITRLLSWKKVEIAIEACEQLGAKLKIVGEGPDLARLKKISNGKTEFLGRVEGKLKYSLLYGCKALINTQLEDFGIVPLEAMSCGKPVIAFGNGGALETVLSEKTGDFFSEQNAASLKNKLEHFDSGKYNAQDCRNRALEFSKEKFKAKVKDYVDNVYL